MTVDSLEIVALTCIFVAPGFIIDIIVNLFCPSGDRKESIHLITCIIYSVVQCALLSWLYVMIWVYRETDFIKFIVYMCLSTLIGSCLLGGLIGLFKSKQWLGNLARKIGLNVSHPIPTAWDYYFSRQIATYVIVTLIDGTRLYGYWGDNSYCSSSKEGRDIYIEKLYQYDEDGEWIENKESQGVVVNQGQIRFIEFVQKGEENE